MLQNVVCNRLITVHWESTVDKCAAKLTAILCYCSQFAIAGGINITSHFAEIVCRSLLKIQFPCQNIESGTLCTQKIWIGFTNNRFTNHTSSKLLGKLCSNVCCICDVMGSNQYNIQ